VQYSPGILINSSFLLSTLAKHAGPPYNAVHRAVSSAG
jgi:hypothetical protein